MPGRNGEGVEGGTHPSPTVYWCRLVLSLVLLAGGIGALAWDALGFSKFLTSWGWVWVGLYYLQVTGVSLRQGLPGRIPALRWACLQWAPFQPPALHLLYTWTLYLQLIVCTGFWAFLPYRLVQHGVVGGIFIFLSHTANLALVLWEGTATGESGLPLRWSVGPFLTPIVYLGWLWIAVYALGESWPYALCTPYLDPRSPSPWLALGFGVALVLMSVLFLLEHYGFPPLHAAVQRWRQRRQPSSSAPPPQPSGQLAPPVVAVVPLGMTVVPQEA